MTNNELLIVAGAAVAVCLIATVSFINHRIAAARWKARYAALLEKYGDAAVVDRIMGRMYWVGQTDLQLVDSLGHPADLDEKVLKTKVKEIWKYHHAGANRYRLRITVENGLVVGWEEKG